MPNKYLDSVQLARLVTKIKSLVSTTVAGYLPLTGGSVTGNLTVSGTITGDVTGDVTGTASGNLPLSGGTVTGDITIDKDHAKINYTDANIGTSTVGLVGNANDYGTAVMSKSGSFSDSCLILRSSEQSANPRFQLRAGNGTTSIDLQGKPDGTLTWDNNIVQTAKQYKTTITPASGFANYNTSYPLTVYRVGNVVQIYGILKTTSQLTDDEHTLFTLPNGYRPIDSIYQLEQGSSMNRWLLKIPTNGVATIARYGTTSSTTIANGAWLPFSATFITTNAYPS